MQETCNSVNGESRTAWRACRDPRFDSFLRHPAFFQSTPGPQNRLPGPRNAATVSRSRFPGKRGPPFPLFRVPRHQLRYLSGLAIDYESLARYLSHCIIYANTLTEGGRGSAPTAVVFLYYHHTPHNFFRHKVPQRTASPAPS